MVCGCAVYQKPRPIYDVPFLKRSQSKIDDEVRVTVAVLTADESRQIFGVNLAGQGIQPVWVRVQNADPTPYWLLSTGLDPDYFSPMESAYTFHGTFSSSANDKIDDQFRVMAFRNPIVEGASVSGFIFTNRDEGTKVVDIDLIGHRKTKFFTFFVQVPGIRADYHEVDFDNLYPEDEIVHLDENQLRTELDGLPYFTDGFRAVLVFDRRPRSFQELESFDWEKPIPNRVKLLDTDHEPDFDDQ